jgi:uracil-DNA glycosylase
MNKFILNNIISKVNIGWLEFINNNKKELEDIFLELNNSNEDIYPYPNNIFKSLFYFSPKDIKLVIIGQDPYINYEIEFPLEKVKEIVQLKSKNLVLEFPKEIVQLKSKNLVLEFPKEIVPQATGLAFSIPKKYKKIPPSLLNIYKEIKNNYPEFIIPSHGSLKRWSKEENILLLNSSLTVINGKSNSHQYLWHTFTDNLIKYINNINDKCIFLLMGNFAINKKKFINENKHKIFSVAHPSPLSAYKGFIGSNIFQNINLYLIENNLEPINWFIY